LALGEDLMFGLIVAAGMLMGLGLVPSSSRQDRAESRPVTEPSSEHYQIDIDYSQVPELKDWVEKQLRPALEEWYPIIIADLPSNGFLPPRRFSIKLEANGSGVAGTAGTEVFANASWIKQQLARGPQNEAVGALVHEAVHVVQHYGQGTGHNETPGWLTEGIADYIRWWKFEPPAMRRPISATNGRGRPASYRNGYQTTAAFLEHVARNHDHEIVVKLNAAARDGRYTPELWRKYTGKTVDQLWLEFAATLKE
jgi:Peptidase of plants and bacteria